MQMFRVYVKHDVNDGLWRFKLPLVKDPALCE